jgi:glycosyltransferase involved in cell wall biosynthesis
MPRVPDSAIPMCVVLPVFPAQECLPAYLDAVRQQSFTDFEMIAVDDSSPDDGGRILDDYARRDSRLRVVHRERNRGLGQARNVVEREVWHHTIIEDDARVPTASRRRFFHHMSEQFRRYQPGPHRHPPGACGSRSRLVERDAYRLFLALRPADLARPRLRAGRRLIGGGR